MHEPDKFLFQQPTLSRGACRNDIFPLGEFGCWSFATWQRGDLHIAAKVVITAIFSDLRGAETWVQMSLEKIARRTRISQRHVRRWITWLCENGFMERRQRAGDVSQFRCAHPDDWQPDPDPLVPYPSQIETPTPDAGVRGQPGNQLQPRTPVSGVSPEINSNPGRPRPDTIDVVDNDKTNNRPVVGNSENSLLQENIDVLHQIGVRPERAVVTLAATVGLTPLKIVLMAIEAKSNAAGYLRRRIEAGAIDPRGGWNAQQIAAAVRRGWLRSLDGYSLDGPETEVKPFPEGLAVYGRGGERIGQISTARLRELAGGLTDAQRRGEGHKRGGQRSADEKARRDDRIQERTHAERLERWEYFNGLSIPRRKRLLQRATIEAAVKTPEAIGEIAIRIAWQERHDTVVAGMDEYDEQTEV